MKAEILTPKQAAIRDMRAAGLDTTVLELRRTVIVEETEEFVLRSIDDGRILNGITPKKRGALLGVYRQKSKTYNHI